LGYGHAARGHARAARRGADRQPPRSDAGGEPGVMAEAGAPLVLLAAGGTGGHLFPAEALAGALARRGVTVDLATDARAARYGERFPARAIHIIPSETFRSRNPVALARTVALLGAGLVKAQPLICRIKPAAADGVGGHPTE